jgi:hypothetical protein
MSLVDLLTPVSCDVPKKRFGMENDGGYVILDRNFGETAVFGYGVGHDVSFEEQVAQHLKCKAYVFDHTLEGKLPEIGPSTTFIEEGITAPPTTNELKTFSDHLDRLVGSEGTVLLKMDVEGAEWDVLEYESFDRVTQFVLEIHDLESDTDRKTKLLRKLRDKFDLVHIHGGNCHNQPTFRYNRVVVIPRYLECTFIRKGLIETKPLVDTYPTSLDNKCRVDARDVYHEFWNMVPIPLNFKVDDEHIPFVQSIMCPCDTINGPDTGYTFMLVDTDAFPFKTVYALNDIMSKGLYNVNFPVMLKDVACFQPRLLHINAEKHGSVQDIELAIHSRLAI